MKWHVNVGGSADWKPERVKKVGDKGVASFDIRCVLFFRYRHFWYVNGRDIDGDTATVRMENGSHSALRIAL